MGKHIKSKYTKLKKLFIGITFIFFICLTIANKNNSLTNKISILNNKSKEQKESKSNINNSLKKKKNYDSTKNQIVANINSIIVKSKLNLISKNYLNEYQKLLKDIIPTTSEKKELSNTAPIAIAGPSKKIIIGEPITLDGSQSYDPDQDEISFKWTLIEAPEQSYIDLSNNTLPIIPLDMQVPGTYVFTLIVSDSKVNSLPSSVEFVIEAKDNNPVAVISGPSRVKKNTDFILSGIESFDPNQKPITEYKWTQTSGPEEVIINQVNSEPYLNLNLSSDGDYQFNLSVFNSNKWSLKSFKTVNVSNDKNFDINIIGRTYLSSINDSEYYLKSKNTINDKYEIKWYFSYKPTGSTSEIKILSLDKVTFKPDQKGYYILKAIVLDSNNQELASSSISIQADPKILNQKIANISENINEDEDRDLFISSGGNKKVCSKDSNKIHIKGNYGGLNSKHYIENWEIVKRPKKCNFAQINKTSNNEYYLHTDKAIGEYRLKYSITNLENNHSIEEYKSVYILSSKLGFNLPKNTGIPKEILQISKDNEYGHKILYGPAEKLFERKRITPGHTYLVIKNLKSNTSYELVSTNLSLSELNKDINVNKSISKTNKKMKMKMKIYNTWKINPSSNLPYYLYLKKDKDYMGNFYIKSTGKEYFYPNIKIEHVPFYDDIPINENVMSELVPSGGKTFLKKIDFIKDKKYYFNSRVFHSKWHGVLNEEEDILTFKVVKRIINNSICYEIQPL